MKKKFTNLALAMMMAVGVSLPAEADVIEHIGDRVIIHVDEMQLNGDESLLDIVMMMPECMSTDGQTTYNNSLYGFWEIRIDNLNINVDAESFLKNTKARDIKTVKLCMNPGIMKGCSNMKKVLDINFRTKEDGVSGTANIEGGTYGNGSSFNTVNYQHDNLNVKGWLVGNAGHEKDYASDMHSHMVSEQAKTQVSVDITPKDNLEVSLTQDFHRSRCESSPVATGQLFEGDAVYTHSLSDDGAYGLLQFNYLYSNERASDGSHSRISLPVVVVEGYFPFLSHNLWLTPGLETGYTYSRDVVGGVTNRQRYEDYYMQLDWQINKFHFMCGDRFRMVNYWNNNDEYEHTWSNHYYTVTAWMNFNKHHTLQALLAHRLFEPDNETFNIRDNAGEIVGYNSENVYKPDCYVSEMRYTYQNDGFILTSLLQNTHQDFDRAARQKSGYDNNLSLGFTARWDVCNWLHLTAGANYNWEKYSNQAKGYVKHNNFVNLRLMPDISVGGWRMLATLLYNSRRSSDDLFPYYTPANFYAALRVSKEVGKHLNLYADAHDLADQRTGNREVSLGLTYKW